MYHKEKMKFTIQTDRENDYRWIAEVPELPGVLAYGGTREEAKAGAEALALRVLSEQLHHGEDSSCSCASTEAEKIFLTNSN
jgi:predicted RNase H-like HicB family nuclease